MCVLPRAKSKQISGGAVIDVKKSITGMDNSLCSIVTHASLVRHAPGRGSKTGTPETSLVRPIAPAGITPFQTTFPFALNNLPKSLAGGAFLPCYPVAGCRRRR
jgi:hypothetical protein